MSIEDAARRFARGQPRRRAVAFRHTRRAPQPVAFSPAQPDEEDKPMIREYDAPRGAGLGGCLANLALLVIILAIAALAAERLGLLGQPQTTVTPLIPPTAIVRVIQSAPVVAPAAPRATEAPAVQQSAPAPQAPAQVAPPRQLIVIEHEGNAPVVIYDGKKRRGRP